MRDDHQRRDPVLTPFFGCGPHTPGRIAAAPAGGDRASRRKPCPTCGDKPPDEDSPFVCMGCHAVAPPIQVQLDQQFGKALATREPERNVMARTVADTCENRFILTEDERADMVRQYPDLAPRWLDSIGQPAAEPAPAAGAAKKSRRKDRREAAARAKVASV